MGFSRTGAAVAVFGLIAAVAGPSATAGAAVAPPPFVTVTGHGAGHGVGVSIAGLVNRAAAGQKAAEALDFYYPETHDTTLAGDPEIRVGIEATPGGKGAPVRLAGGAGGPCSPAPWSPLQIVATDVSTVIGPNEVAAVIHGDDRTIIQRQRPDGTVLEEWTTNGDVVAYDPDGGPVRALDLSAPCHDRYRGSVAVHWSDHGTADTTDDRLWVVNNLRLESYVWGIAEGPDDLPAEAAKALAITARTFAWDKVEGSRYKVDGFDIASSSAFLPEGFRGATQLYLGQDAERPALRAGAMATASRVRTYGGEGAILATYSANGGPVTGDPRNELGMRGPVAYLVERPDPFYKPDHNASWQREVNPHTGADALDLPTGDLVGYGILSRTAGGRPATISVIGMDASATIDAPTFRSRLGLPSDFVDVPAVRLAGDNRAGTAAAVARELHPAGASAVVIVSGEYRHLSDALVAAPLARAYDAPILLAGPDGLPPETVDELSRQQANDVIVVGGEAAVPPVVIDQLSSRGRVINRVAGEDRYATAAAVARTIGAPRPGAVLANGAPEHAADALAAAGPAAALGWPVLLTAQDQLPAVTRAALNDLAPPTVAVAGGASAVSDPVVEAVNNATRVAGNDRWETAAALARFFGPRVAATPGLHRAVLASGEDGHLADALAGGALGALVILTPGTGDGAAPAAVARERRLDIGRFLVLGGSSAVSDATAGVVTAALDDW